MKNHLTKLQGRIIRLSEKCLTFPKLPSDPRYFQIDSQTSGKVFSLKFLTINVRMEIFMNVKPVAYLSVELVGQVQKGIIALK